MKHLVLALLLLATVTASIAAAARKPHSTTGTVTGPFMVIDQNGNGLPNWADTVTFTVSTPVPQPYINLLCSQNGVNVYDSWKGVFPGSLDTNWNFVLGSGGWTGGAATCTAWLGYFTKQGFQRLGSDVFDVAA